MRLCGNNNDVRLLRPPSHLCSNFYRSFFTLHACRVNSKVGSAGAGQKLGGESSAPAAGADSVDARRARMLAAAEARMNAGAS